jgi:ATP-dependent DNA helicase RecG
MMTRSELLEIINNGENSGVEFKRDVVANHVLAKELVAFSNLNGGMVLLGGEDDGTISRHHAAGSGGVGHDHLP